LNSSLLSQDIPICFQAVHFPLNWSVFNRSSRNWEDFETWRRKYIQKLDHVFRGLKYLRRHWKLYCKVSGRL
jgi:hypothetical protein